MSGADILSKIRISTLALDKKKCLVFGSNGFIGRHLVNALKEDAVLFTVYNRNKDQLDNEVFNISIGELDNFNELIDQVFIASAYTPAGKIDIAAREKMYKSNVELIDNVCTKYKNSKIIYCSSVSVYKQNDGIINEISGEGGFNEYGISKLWGERIIEQHNRFAILRLSSVYGNGMKLNSIIPNYINQALGERTIKVWGNGKRKQNYIHVSDAVNMMLRAASQTENGKYLATSAESISNLQLAEIISMKTGSKITFEGEDDTPSFLYDNSYSVEALGYSARISIENGINEVITWMKEKY